MSPAAITQGVNASPTPAPQPATMPARKFLPHVTFSFTHVNSYENTAIPAPSPNLPNKPFDDIFHNKFMNIITKWKEEPQRGQLTQKERKAMIEKAYIETDEMYFGKRPLNAEELRMRCLTKVFYKVLAEEPWSEDWIRAPDVERKLSKFEMHPATLDLARAHNLNTPREAVRAAREHAIKAPNGVPATGEPCTCGEAMYPICGGWWWTWNCGVLGDLSILTKLFLPLLLRGIRVTGGKHALLTRAWNSLAN